MANIELNKVCDVRDGTHDSPKSVSEGYPLVTSKNIIDDLIDISNVNYISEEDYKAINKRSNVDHGDILMPMIGTIGGTVIVNKEFEFAIKNVALIKFHKDSKVTAKYIKYVLDSNLFIRYVESENRGNTQKFLSLGKIRSFPIPLISIERQREITSILDNLSQTIKKRKEQIELFDVLIKSRFVDMFGFIDKTKFDISKLEDLCEFITDGTHQTPTYTEDKKNGFKFLSSKDVTSGKIDWTKIKYIPADLHEQLYKRVSPQRNDILLAKNGTTGVAAIVDNDEVFDIYVSLAILRFKEGNNPYFLLYAINSVDTKRQFDSSLKGVGVPNLHLGEIRKTRIVLPPIELQNQYADFVQQVDKLKVEVQKSLEETQILFDSLMQKYFS